MGKSVPSVANGSQFRSSHDACRVGMDTRLSVKYVKLLEIGSDMLRIQNGHARRTGDTRRCTRNSYTTKIDSGSWPTANEYASNNAPTVRRIVNGIEREA